MRKTIRHEIQPHKATGCITKRAYKYVLNKTPCILSSNIPTNEYSSSRPAGDQWDRMTHNSFCLQRFSHTYSGGHSYPYSNLELLSSPARNPLPFLYTSPTLFRLSHTFLRPLERAGVLTFAARCFVTCSPFFPLPPPAPALETEDARLSARLRPAFVARAAASSSSAPPL